MDSFKAGTFGLVVGAIFIGGIALGGLFAYSPLANSDTIKVFSREGKPSVMRLYRTGTDAILVEDPKSKGTYVTLSKYLTTINDSSARKVEEGEIEQAVNWND